MCASVNVKVYPLSMILALHEVESKSHVDVGYMLQHH